jgi:hypothetical protein
MCRAHFNESGGRGHVGVRHEKTKSSKKKKPMTTAASSSATLGKQGVMGCASGVKSL